MRGAYEEIGLLNEYSVIIAAMNWCRTARDQYAHCHWWDQGFGKDLCFKDLEEAADQRDPANPAVCLVTIHLLQEQEAFFFGMSIAVCSRAQAALA